MILHHSSQSLVQQASPTAEKPQIIHMLRPTPLHKSFTSAVRASPLNESIGTALELAKLEGIFTGISGGASLNAALKVAQEAEPGSVLLAMLPDTGERYLSTPLLENVNEGTDADWLETL